MRACVRLSCSILTWRVFAIGRHRCQGELGVRIGKGGGFPRRLHKGSLFGERGMFAAGNLRGADVVALTDGYVGTMLYSELELLGDTYPELMRSFVRTRRAQTSGRTRPTPPAAPWWHTCRSPSRGLRGSAVRAPTTLRRRTAALSRRRRFIAPRAGSTHAPASAPPLARCRRPLQIGGFRQRGPAATSRATGCCSSSRPRRRRGAHREVPRQP